ncbi:hypothetical protein H5J25_16330 [Sphingomonas aliaeris]|uniref:Uncharacterized protein n=1 Tax=Sphingomonas aliaeris TaxID=2759526 RepID=A0A974NUB0_9SPHN|nr:hypothetical protein [Sphingomonas aliaeris]QQV76928.1 hypothetical protein H5J25_16330 [Sphingomonas aliaeris]
MGTARACRMRFLRGSSLERAVELIDALLSSAPLNIAVVYAGCFPIVPATMAIDVVRERPLTVNRQQDAAASCVGETSIGIFPAVWPDRAIDDLNFIQSRSPHFVEIQPLEFPCTNHFFSQPSRLSR